MSQRPEEEYLRTQIMSASPQRLHLMMLDGAIRYATQARNAWDAGDRQAVSELLIRSQEIMAEMVAGFKAETDPDLVHKAAGVYLFILRSLVAANVHREFDKLNDALRILDFERETWRQICAQTEDAAGDATVDSRHAPTSAPHVPAPKSPFHSAPTANKAQGLNFEA